MNREAWLTQLIELLRPMFIEKGAPLPEGIHVSVGFPSRGALSANRQRIGECWPDGKQIFISPVLADGLRAADVLVHELIHQALPSGTGHKGPFKKLAKTFGLEGKPTATTAGPELSQQLQALLAKLGPYPHPGLTAGSAQRKKQSTRLLKAECPTCGYTVRVTATWLRKGAPICPVDSVSMEGDEEETE